MHSDAIRTHLMPVFSAASDVFLAIVSAIVFWKLQVTLKTKIGVCITMGLTIVAAACTIARTVKAREWRNFYDLTYRTVDLTIWTVVAANVLIIAACGPSLGAFIMVIQDRIRRRKGSKDAQSEASWGYGSDGRVIRGRECHEPAAYDTNGRHSRRGRWNEGKKAAVDTTKPLPPPPLFFGDSRRASGSVTSEMVPVLLVTEAAGTPEAWLIV